MVLRQVTFRYAVWWCPSIYIIIPTKVYIFLSYVGEDDIIHPDNASDQGECFSDGNKNKNLNIVYG